MATGIKDKIAILGMGCTKFGERWDMQEEDLIVDAYNEAMEDAGIEKKDIEASWFGSCFDEVNVGKSAIVLPMTLKLPFIGATRVENFCASGTEAFRGACYAGRVTLRSRSEPRSSKTPDTAASQTSEPQWGRSTA